MNYPHTMSEDDIKPKRMHQATLQRDLGQRIVQLRKARGWKQGDLAKRLEVPSDRLGKWERGLNAPSLEDLMALKAVLEVTLDELMQGVPPAAPPFLAPAERAQLGMFLTGVLRILKPVVAPGGVASRAAQRKE
jgi:transcriptional regulator with XRE-family HTH domain